MSFLGRGGPGFESWLRHGCVVFDRNNFPSLPPCCHALSIHGCATELSGPGVFLALNCRLQWEKQNEEILKQRNM